MGKTVLEIRTAKEKATPRARRLTASSSPHGTSSVAVEASPHIAEGHHPDRRLKRRDCGRFVGTFSG
jgi:hypothetical protein